MKRRQRAGIKKRVPSPQRGGKKEKAKRVSRVFFFSLLLIFAASLTASYLFFKPMFVFDSSFIEEIEARHAGPKVDSDQTDTGRLYRSDSNTQLSWFNGENRKDSALAVAEGVIRKYLKAYGTVLLDLYMDREGVIYVDIGSDIRKNYGKNARDEYNVVAGLCWSLRTSIPEFTSLKILIEGKEARSIGGHIDISRPVRGDITEIVDNR